MVGLMGGFVWYRLYKDYTALQKDFSQCSKTLHQLQEAITVKDHEYKMKVQSLITKLNQKPKVVKVPVEVPVEIKVNDEECRKLYYMIEQNYKEFSP